MPDGELVEETRPTCTHCGAVIERGRGRGTGIRAEGIFCDLNCFVARYGDQILARKASELHPGRNN